MEGRFKIGDRVRVKLENYDGNPRTPKYARGKSGVVAAAHGRIENPHDHRGVYPPLYTVRFKIRDLFGTDTRDEANVDVHEEWLEPEQS